MTIGKEAVPRMPLWTLGLVVPTHLGKKMTTTLIEALDYHAKSRPEGVAFHFGEDVWTYERLMDEVQRLACGLVERGLRKGSRVALHMANVPELAVAYAPAFELGLSRHP